MPNRPEQGHLYNVIDIRTSRTLPQARGIADKYAFETETLLTEAMHGNDRTLPESALPLVAALGCEDLAKKLHTAIGDAANAIEHETTLPSKSQQALKYDTTIRPEIVTKLTAEVQEAILRRLQQKSGMSNDQANASTAAALKSAQLAETAHSHLIEAAHATETLRMRAEAANKVLSQVDPLIRKEIQQMAYSVLHYAADQHENTGRPVWNQFDPRWQLAAATGIALADDPNNDGSLTIIFEGISDNPYTVNSAAKAMLTHLGFDTRNMLEIDHLHTKDRKFIAKTLVENAGDNYNILTRVSIWHKDMPSPQ